MTKRNQQLLSIVIPAYNEEAVLSVFHKRLGDVLAKISMQSELIFVNDGSRDNTLLILHTLKQQDDRIAIVELSRNFGKEIALTAGLDHAQGDAVIVIDADLQDPPELIPELINEWQQGFDVVYAQRTEREGESWLKKTTAAIFYRIMQRLANKINIPHDTGDFRLLSRRAVDALKQFREQHRFMKGLFSWIGFAQKAVPYKRDSRFAGETKWNYWKLWNFAIDGITSFTTGPLKIATYLGLFTAIMAFVYALWIIFKVLAFGEIVRGYPTLMVVILFLGGVQLFALGVIGEYIGRMFDESKRRPLYLIQGYLPAKIDLQYSGDQKTSAVTPHL